MAASASVSVIEHERQQVSVQDWISFLKKEWIGYYKEGKKYIKKVEKRYMKNIRSIEDAKDYFLGLRAATLGLKDNIPTNEQQLDTLNQYIIYPDVTVNNQFYVCLYERLGLGQFGQTIPNYYSLLKIRFSTEGVPQGFGEIHISDKDLNFKLGEVKIKQIISMAESSSGTGYTIVPGFKTYTIQELKEIIFGLKQHKPFIPSAGGFKFPTGGLGSLAGDLDPFAGALNFSAGGHGGGRRRRSRKAKKNKAHTPK